MTPDRWKLIDELYHETLDLDVNARGEFLKRKCLDDESLLRDVEALLSAHEKAADFMDTTALNDLARTTMVSCTRFQIGPLHRRQSFACHCFHRFQCQSQARSRGADSFQTEPSKHLHDSRSGRGRWPNVHRHGIGGRGTAKRTSSLKDHLISSTFICASNTVLNTRHTLRMESTRNVV